LNEFVLKIYSVSGSFPKTELFGLIPQIKRAAVSIIANISEGYARKTRKEYLHFLCIARGSLSEIDCYLNLLKDLKYLADDAYIDLEERRLSLARLLKALINSLNRF
jgi:four helix bundle protein